MSQQCINCGYVETTCKDCGYCFGCCGCRDHDDEMVEVEECPKCGRDYDEIEYEYQFCSKCGWDEENKKWITPRELDNTAFKGEDK